jgi:hypothetical protein
MAHTDTRVFRAEIAPQRAEIASQSSVRAERESDDDFDFPPTAHPGRELFTASLFVLLIMALVVWGGWKLISLIWVWLPFPSSDRLSRFHIRLMGSDWPSRGLPSWQFSHLTSVNVENQRADIGGVCVWLEPGSSTGSRQ